MFFHNRLTFLVNYWLDLIETGRLDKHLKKSFAMNLQKILYLFCFGFGFVYCAQVASAEVSQHKYNVYVSGLKVGELDYAVNTKGSAYSIRALMRSTGIVGAFKKYRYEGLSMGRTNNGRFFPQKYAENSDTGNRKSNKEMVYKNGIPRLTQSEDRKDHWLDPKTQKNTADPLSAIYGLLSDQPLEKPCTQNITVYDGARRYSIKLVSSQIDGTEMSCQGIFTRLGGYSEKELSQGIEFPFELQFSKQDNVFRIDRFVMSTLLGRASFVRQ